MKNIFKQFVGWDTPSNQSEFKKAVVLLTVYYTTGVFIVLAIFNLMVYGLFSNTIRSGDNETREQSIQQGHSKLGESGIQEMQDNLINVLLFSDAIILIITLMVAYMSSKRTLAPLEISYKKQARFVADAAHELRTPLSVMKAGAEVMIRQDRTKDEYKNFISESLDEVERLTSLSNDLLFLANNNKKISVLSDINFGDLCKQQINKILVYAKTKGININDNIEENLIIKGKSEDIERLIMNLLKNAIDYNNKDGSVHVSLTRTENKINLTISDTGIGMSKENITHVFERFYKADNSRTQNSSGTGLGLAIVKEIIDEHNASIKIDSQIGKGTNINIAFNCI